MEVHTPKIPDHRQLRNVRNFYANIVVRHANLLGVTGTPLQRTVRTSLWASVKGVIGLTELLVLSMVARVGVVLAKLLLLLLVYLMMTPARRKLLKMVDLLAMLEYGGEQRR